MEDSSEPLDVAAWLDAQWQEKLPPKVRWAELERTPPKVQEWVASTAAGFAGNLVMVGPVGTGKTYAAYAAARRLRLRNMKLSLKIVEAHDMFRRLRPEQDDPLTLDELGVTDLMVLDDLGTKAPSAFEVESLYKVANHRWKWERPVIVTSNLTPRELGETWGDRTCDRMFDGAMVVKFDGDSLRRAPQVA